MKIKGLDLILFGVLLFTGMLFMFMSGVRESDISSMYTVGTLMIGASIGMVLTIILEKL